MAELRACPFCGSNDLRHYLTKHSTGTFLEHIVEAVQCLQCKAEAPNPAAWNRRAGEQNSKGGQ